MHSCWCYAPPLDAAVSGESYALRATLVALFWNTPGRSSCYALLFFLRHSSMRLMLRSDLQHVLDARLLGFSWSFNTLSWYYCLGFSWNFQHPLGATLLTSSWNCQRSLDASLLCCAFSLGSSNRLLMLRTKLPHVLNTTRSILFDWTSWAFSWNTRALSSFGFGQKLKKVLLLQLNDWSLPQGFSTETEVAKTRHTILIITSTFIFLHNLALVIRPNPCLPSGSPSSLHSSIYLPTY